MSISVKIRVATVFSCALIVFILAVFFFLSNRKIPEPVKAADQTVIAAPPEKIVTKAQPCTVPKQFESTDEIRKEYGRLEVVTLRGGRRLEGVVISTSDTYVMVTVNGTEKFPMKDVEAREIVR